MWWTEIQISLWDEESNLVTEFCRIKSTPFSILEFDSDLFKSLEVTDEIRHENSPEITNSTLFRKYLYQHKLPIPSGSFNGFYDYPLSLMGYYDKVLKEIKYYDFSSFVNLEYLKEMNCSVDDYFLSSNEWDCSAFDEDQFFLMEYSRL
ncbi:MAG: hypothetical protein PSV36_19030 [Algoriphagus sp.]|nr:hypothetical protein [Algoriphagus sp.]